MISSCVNQINHFLLPDGQKSPVPFSIFCGVSCAVATHFFTYTTSKLFNINPMKRDLVVDAKANADRLPPVTYKCSLAWMYLFGFCVGPMFEEFLFRDKLYTYSEGYFPNPSIHSLAIAFVFAMTHLSPRQGKLNAVVFSNSFLQGLAYNYLRKNSGGLLAPIVAHATHNVFASIFDYATTVTGYFSLRSLTVREGRNE